MLCEKAGGKGWSSMRCAGWQKMRSDQPLLFNTEARWTDVLVQRVGNRRRQTVARQVLDERPEILVVVAVLASEVVLERDAEGLADVDHVLLLDHTHDSVSLPRLWIRRRLLAQRVGTGDPDGSSPDATGEDDVAPESSSFLVRVECRRSPKRDDETEDGTQDGQKGAADGERYGSKPDAEQRPTSVSASTQREKVAALTR
jgi:hypothetical protein